MSHDYEQLIALAPWAAFLLAVLVFWLIDLRARVVRARQSRRSAATRRAASPRAGAPPVHIR